MISTASASQSHRSTSTLVIESETLRLVEDAVAFAGPFQRPATTAIVVGARDMALPRAIHALLPSVETILVLEPDPIQRRRAQQMVDAGVKGLRSADAYVFAHEEVPTEGYSIDAYVLAARFLMASGAAAGDTPMLVDEPSFERNPDMYIPLVNSLIDLDWEQSRTFLGLLPSAEALPADLVFRWPHYLTQNGAPYHALKFLFAVRPLLGDRSWARRVAHCFDELRCQEPLLELVPFLGSTPEERRGLERELLRNVEQEQARSKAQLRSNLAALAAHSPQVVDRLGALSGPSYIMASLPPIAWWLTMIPEIPVLRERFPLFFRVNELELEELNPPTCPKPLHEALMSAPKSAPAAVLVGGMERVDTLQNLGAVYPGPFYVLEERLDVARTVLGYVDFQPLLRSPSSRIWLGPGGHLEMVRVLCDHPELPLPDARLAIPSGLEGALSLLSIRRSAPSSSNCS